MVAVGMGTMLFVEMRPFTALVGELLDDETYRKVQNELIENPHKGDVIPESGGLRKLRVENPKRGKGKRGGCATRPFSRAA